MTIRLNYSTRHKAVLVKHNEVTVAMLDRNESAMAKQADLLVQISQMGNLGPPDQGTQTVKFSEKLWEEILKTGTIIDDD